MVCKFHDHQSFQTLCMCYTSHGLCFYSQKLKRKLEVKLAKQKSATYKSIYKPDIHAHNEGKWSHLQSVKIK